MYLCNNLCLYLIVFGSLSQSIIIRMLYINFVTSNCRSFKCTKDFIAEERVCVKLYASSKYCLKRFASRSDIIITLLAAMFITSCWYKKYRWIPLRFLSCFIIIFTIVLFDTFPNTVSQYIMCYNNRFHRYFTHKIYKIKQF